MMMILASSRRSDNWGAPRRAFTLIELIVVVAIIAILASFLLTGVKSLRDLSESTQCQTSLRQIGMAHQAWSQDNRGQICPTGGYVSSGGQHGDTQNWGRMLMDYMQEELTGDATLRKDDATRRHLTIHTCRAASRSYKTLWGGMQDSLAVSDPLAWQWRLTSYGQNLFPGAPADYTSSFASMGFRTGYGGRIWRWGQITSAARRPLDTEAWYMYVTPVLPCAQDVVWAIPGNTLEYFTPQRHRGGNNSLFYDLHVQQLPPAAIVQAMLDPAQISF